MSSLRKFKPSLDALECRAVPALIPFTITIRDPQGLLAPFPNIAAAIPKAEQTLSSLFEGQGSIQVEVVPSGLANRGGGAPTAVVPVGTSGGYTVVETAAEFEAQTGVDANGSGPEVVITLNQTTYLPGEATGPEGLNNMIYVLEHETLHGLGFTGYRTIVGADYGQILGTTESVYDSLTEFGAGGNPNILYFVGPRAEALYGGPVPLTTLGASDTTGENFYHVGNPDGQPGSSLLGDLMNGLAFSDVPPGAMDLAILSDLGWGTVSTLPPIALPSVTSVAGAGGRSGLTSVSLTFDEAVDATSVMSAGLYTVLGGVTKHHKVMYTKKIKVSDVSYDSENFTVMLRLARPFKGMLRVAVQGEIHSVNLSEGDVDYLGYLTFR